MDYFKIGNCGWTIGDTGFGNRIQFWEIAFRFAQYNDFKFAVMVDGNKWKETKYLDFPYTKSSVRLYHQLQNLEKIDVTQDEGGWLKEIETNKSYYIKDDMDDENDWEWSHSKLPTFGHSLHLIELKDKELKKRIQDRVWDRIGIHIRHWPVVDTNIYDSRITIPRFDYKKKMKQVRKTMELFRGNPFYLSTDCTYEEPGQGPYLPDFRDENQWVSELYNDFDIIDYRDILQEDFSELLPNTYQDNRNPGWSKVLDKEGKILETIKYDEDEHYDTLDKIEDMKIRRDIVDLFSLIYCGGDFISSDNTGPGSSWSDFVSSYRYSLLNKTDVKMK
jgi:hypothetical protein|tara:strand:- start:946 stop:1944 length:999 start_codon:yes stop_codon:yes gene_type:complete